MKLPAILMFLLLPICASGQSVADLIKQGDALDAKNQNREAVEIFLKADALKPTDAETLRRVAKQYSQQMINESTSAGNKELGRKALDYAERAKAADPKNANARLALAICYGKVAFLEPARTRIEYSRLIKQEVDASLALDDSNDYAWHVLGRWNYELTNFNAALRFLAQAIYGKFPEASNERAAQCFEKAIALQPRRVIHHVELGRAYAALGRKDEARAELEKGISLPSREKDDEESKDRARAALNALR